MAKYCWISKNSWPWLGILANRRIQVITFFDSYHIWIIVKWKSFYRQNPNWSRDFWNFGRWFLHSQTWLEARATSVYYENSYIKDGIKTFFFAWRLVFLSLSIQKIDILSTWNVRNLFRAFCSKSIPMLSRFAF